MATIDVGRNATTAPEAQHKAVNALVARISLSLSWSSGDVHRVGKLPHDAIPLDAIFYPGAATGGAAVFKFGTSASQELFFNSLTYSIVSRCARRLAWNAQVSLSDDAMPREENVVMVATAGVSVGHVGDLVVFYRMPGQRP